MTAADEIRKRIAEVEAMIAKIDPVASPTLMTIWKSELSMARECLAIVEREAAPRPLNLIEAELERCRADCDAWRKNYDERGVLLNAERAIRQSVEKRCAELEAAIAPAPDADGWIPWCERKSYQLAGHTVVFQIDTATNAIIAYRIVKEAAHDAG